jgi:hypothetical protein
MGKLRLPVSFQTVHDQSNANAANDFAFIRKAAARRVGHAHHV